MDLKKGAYAILTDRGIAKIIHNLEDMKMNVGGVTTNYPIGYEARRTQRAATEKTFARDSYTYCGTGHLRIGGMVSMALDK